MKKPCIVIIGAGFGGLNAAKALKNKNANVILIDKMNHHLFQPLLYQVATSALSISDISCPLRTFFSSTDNTEFLMGEVEKIDRTQKKIYLDQGIEVSYEYLIIATGSRQDYFGNPDWERYAPGLKNISDAVILREKILLAYEFAERLPNPSERDPWMRFMIVGGGPTGVEMAGALAEIARTSLKNHFKNISPEKSEIHIVEASPGLLSMYPAHLQKITQDSLEKMGVHVHTSTKVENITEEGVTFNGSFYPCKTVIWAAGNTASPILRTLGLPQDKHNRILVNKFLQPEADPFLYVIGDAACCLGKDGYPLPALAPVALQQGKYVAHHILGEEKNPFSYFDKGSMATIGRGKAVAVMGKKSFSGWTAWLAWGFIHIFYLISFHNRLFVMLQWIFLYLFQQRNIQTIPVPISDPLFRKEKKSL